MVEPSPALPIIDMSLAKTDREKLGRKLVHVLENIGFLYIDNATSVDHSILYKCCEWFFGQKWEVKNKILRNFWNQDNHNVYRGYFPIVEGEPSRKEGFECGRDVPPNDPSVAPGNWFYEPSPWPGEDGSFPFKLRMTETYEAFHELSLEILRLTAIGLGIAENSFENILNFNDKPLTTYRIMHYPPWDGKPPDKAIIEDGKVVITPEHTDSDFITLLCTFDFEGLEVLTADGKWIEVPPRPGSLIMNIGDAFSKVMGGRFKATRHRVIAIGVDRFSVPFFLSPPFDSDIGVKIMKKEAESGSDHVYEKYGPWLLNRMRDLKKYFEYKVLPDVK